MANVTNIRRRHERYDVVNSGGEPLKASIRLLDSQDITNVTLVNLSQTGARLTTSEPLGKGAGPNLTLEFKSNELLSIDVTILWTEPKNDGLWLSGCEFSATIQLDVINDLANAGALDRRFADRLPAAIDCHARRELEGQQRIAVQIINHSEGGICLYSPERLYAGEKLLFEFDDDKQASVLAEIKWCRTSDDIHLAGCALRSSGVTLPFSQPAEQSVDKTTNEIVQRSRTAVWAGLALVLGWCALYLANYWPIHLAP